MTTDTAYKRLVSTLLMGALFAEQLLFPVAAYGAVPKPCNFEVANLAAKAMTTLREHVLQDPDNFDAVMAYTKSIANTSKEYAKVTGGDSIKNTTCLLLLTKTPLPEVTPADLDTATAHIANEITEAYADAAVYQYFTLFALPGSKSSAEGLYYEIVTRLQQNKRLFNSHQDLRDIAYKLAYGALAKPTTDPEVNIPRAAEQMYTARLEQMLKSNEAYDESIAEAAQVALNMAAVAAGMHKAIAAEEPLDDLMGTLQQREQFMERYGFGVDEGLRRVLRHPLLRELSFLRASLLKHDKEKAESAKALMMLYAALDAEKESYQKFFSNPTTGLYEKDDEGPLALGVPEFADTIYSYIQTTYEHTSARDYAEKILKRKNEGLVSGLDALVLGGAIVGGIAGGTLAAVSAGWVSAGTVIATVALEGADLAVGFGDSLTGVPFVLWEMVFKNVAIGGITGIAKEGLKGLAVQGVSRDARRLFTFGLLPPRSSARFTHAARYSRAGAVTLAVSAERGLSKRTIGALLAEQARAAAAKATQILARVAAFRPLSKLEETILNKKLINGVWENANGLRIPLQASKDAALRARALEFAARLDRPSIAMREESFVRFVKSGGRVTPGPTRANEALYEELKQAGKGFAAKYLPFTKFAKKHNKPVLVFFEAEGAAKTAQSVTPLDTGLYIREGGNMTTGFRPDGLTGNGAGLSNRGKPLWLEHKFTSKEQETEYLVRYFEALEQQQGEMSMQAYEKFNTLSYDTLPEMQFDLATAQMQMDEALVTTPTINLLKKELLNPDVSAVEKENIIKYLQRTTNYQTEYGLEHGNLAAAFDQHITKRTAVLKTASSAVEDIVSGLDRLAKFIQEAGGAASQAEADRVLERALLDPSVQAARTEIAALMAKYGSSLKKFVGALGEGWDVPLEQLYDTSSLAGKARLVKVRSVVEEILGNETKYVARGRKPRLILTAGMPGAGKTTALKRVLGDNYADNFAVLNIDEVKPKLGWSDAPYTGANDTFFQNEASHIVDHARQVAMQQKKDIIIDGTLSDFTWAKTQIDEAVAQGYEVEIVGVTIRPAIALERALVRSQSDVRRYAPLDYVRRLANSVNENVYRLAKEFDLLPIQKITVFNNDKTLVEWYDAVK